MAGILNIRKGDEKKEMRKLLRSWHEWMLDGKVAARGADPDNNKAVFRGLPFQGFFFLKKIY